MNLVPLPAIADDPAWMLHDGRGAVVVDPDDEAPIHAALGAQSLRPVGILVMLHHSDRVPGVDPGVARLRGPTSYAPGDVFPGPGVPPADGTAAVGPDGAGSERVKHLATPRRGMGPFR